MLFPATKSKLLAIVSKTINDLNDVGNKLYNTLSKKNVNMLELLCDVKATWQKRNVWFILRENDR